MRKRIFISSVLIILATLSLCLTRSTNITRATAAEEILGFSGKRAQASQQDDIAVTGEQRQKNENKPSFDDDALDKRIRFRLEQEKEKLNANVEEQPSDFDSALAAVEKEKEAQEKRRDVVVILFCIIAGIIFILLIWGFCSFVKREKRLYGPMYGNMRASTWIFGIIAGCLTLLAGAVELDDNGLVEALPYLNFSCLFFCGAWFLTSYLKGKSLKEGKEASLNSSSKEKGDGTNQVRPG